MGITGLNRSQLRQLAHRNLQEHATTMLQRRGSNEPSTPFPSPWPSNVTTIQPSTGMPGSSPSISAPANAEQITGVTMIVVNPSTLIVEMYEDCNLNGTLGTLVP
jgi:hypothetical protein